MRAERALPLRGPHQKFAVLAALFTMKFVNWHTLLSLYRKLGHAQARAAKTQLSLPQSEHRWSTLDGDLDLGGTASTPSLLLQGNPQDQEFLGRWSSESPAVVPPREGGVGGAPRGINPAATNPPGRGGTVDTTWRWLKNPYCGNLLLGVWNYPCTQVEVYNRYVVVHGWFEH